VALAGLLTTGAPLGAQAVGPVSVPGAVAPLLALAFVGLAAPGATLSPQPAESTIVNGRWVLGFALPSGGGSSINIGRMVAPQTALGLEISLSQGSTSSKDADTTGRSQSSQTDSWSIRVGPTLRWYQHIGTSVAPFLLLAAGVSAGHSTQVQSSVLPPTTSVFTNTSDDRGAYFRAGYGVEWVPVTSVSFGGWVGAEWTYGRSDGVSNSFTRHSSSNGFHTLVSALTLQVYF
jgi:hypothetical protein